MMIHDPFTRLTVIDNQLVFLIVLFGEIDNYHKFENELGI